MISQHPAQVEILPLTQERSVDAFALACEVFVAGSVLHRATQVSLKEYQAYMAVPFEAMREQGFSLVAQDMSNRQIIGCLLAADYLRPKQNVTRVPASLEPIAALLQQLEGSYRNIRSPKPGDCMLVDMVVVSPLVQGLGIYRRLREAVQPLACAAGFKWIVGELSAAATQHVCVGRLGHRVCTEIDYDSFVYQGRKPFAVISEPRSIQLVEAELS